LSGSFLLSASIELFQLFSVYRSANPYDIVTNVLGALAGWYVARRWLWQMPSIAITQLTGALAIVAALPVFVTCPAASWLWKAHVVGSPPLVYACRFGSFYYAIWAGAFLTIGLVGVLQPRERDVRWVISIAVGFLIGLAVRSYGLSASALPLIATSVAGAVIILLTLSDCGVEEKP
jgi:hypothetical protein